MLKKKSTQSVWVLLLLKRLLNWKKVEKCKGTKDILKNNLYINFPIFFFSPSNKGGVPIESKNPLSKILKTKE